MQLLLRGLFPGVFVGAEGLEEGALGGQSLAVSAFENRHPAIFEGAEVNFHHRSV